MNSYPEDVCRALNVMGMSSSGSFSKEELDRRLRELNRRYHPDRKDGGNEEKVKEINAAYTVVAKHLSGMRKQ